METKPLPDQTLEGVKSQNNHGNTRRQNYLEVKQNYKKKRKTKWHPAAGGDVIMGYGEQQVSSVINHLFFSEFPDFKQWCWLSVFPFSSHHK